MERNILGNILRINREKLRLSIQDVANRVDVSEENVALWERGTLEPTLYDKLFLSYLFSIPMSLLLSKFDEDIEKSFSFRAVSGDILFPEPYMYIFASKAQSIRNFLNLVNEKLSIDRDNPPIIETEFIHLDEEEAAYLSNINEIDENAKNIIHKKSQEFHNYYNLKYGPKQDLLNHLPRQSTTVVYTPVPDGYNGITFVSEDNNDFYVFISSQDHYCKQTFTLIHEIGHVIFHSINNHDLIEDIINYFVNVTLLPPCDIKDKFNNVSSVGINNIDHYKSLLEEISKNYEVSYKTILYSLYHIGKLNYEGNISDYINYIMFQKFNEDSAVKKISYRYNKVIHTYLKELLGQGMIDTSYVKEMNNIAPFMA